VIDVRRIDRRWPRDLEAIALVAPSVRQRLEALGVRFREHREGDQPEARFETVIALADGGEFFLIEREVPAQIEVYTAAAELTIDEELQRFVEALNLEPSELLAVRDAGRRPDWSRVISTPRPARKTRRRRRFKTPEQAVQQWRKLDISQDGTAHERLLVDALRDFPDDPELLLLYASGTVDRPQDATAAIARAVDVAGDDPAVLTRAAYTSLEMSDWISAAEYVRRAHALSDAEFVLAVPLASALGYIAAYEGNDRAAEDLLSFAYAREPGEFHHAAWYAEFLVVHGRPVEALAVARYGLELEPSDTRLGDLVHQIESGGAVTTRLGRGLTRKEARRRNDG
jgi:Flp pilus assembly protein TadD